MYMPLIITIKSSLFHHHAFWLLVLLLWFIEITSFVSTNRVNLCLIPKFIQDSNRCKRVFEAIKLAYAFKTRESIFSQKRSS